MAVIPNKWIEKEKDKKKDSDKKPIVKKDKGLPHNNNTLANRMKTLRGVRK